MALTSTSINHNIGLKPREGGELRRDIEGRPYWYSYKESEKVKEAPTKVSRTKKAPATELKEVEESNKEE